jgi:hypothetical protein
VSRSRSLEIVLGAEVDQVREELGLLVSRILPLLLPDGQDAGGAAQQQDGPRSLNSWQRVARELAAALPRPDGRPGKPIDEAFLEGFLHQLALACFCVREGEIVWKNEVFMMVDLDDQSARHVLELMHGEPVAESGARGRLLRDFDAFKNWFLGPAPEPVFVVNAMCSVLPTCVDLDLEFVREAFDLERRIARIRSDHSASEEERTRRLHDWSCLVVMHGFNNALLHVIAALANNHFDQIERFLDHPARNSGFYTGLMPHYLVAVLHQKVRILNELRREDRERVGVNALIRGPIGCPT